MIKSQIIKQYTRRILAHSKSGCLFRSFETLADANQPTPSRIQTVTDQKEKWSKQGHQVKPSDVRCLIKNLRDSNQFSQALEASEWMGEQKVFDIFAEDYAARLYLVDHVLGLEEAEKFFKSIPVNMRDYFVHSTLLSSYTRSEKTLDKAEATFEKMRKLGFLLKPSPFNSMISLYGQLKNRDMVENLVREMQEQKVGLDSATWNNVLRVYADPSKVKEMETYKTRVDEQGIKLEGSTVVAMARAYNRSGLVQKAIEMYGDVPGTQREVYALWNEYKKEAKDDGYRTMMNSLLKLNNLEGAEKIFEEWNPEGTKLDMSVPRLLISRYYADGKEQKVDEMLNSIKKKRYGMHMKKLRYHTKRMFSNFTFRKMKRPYRINLPDLTVLKERLKVVGELIICVAVLVAVAGGYALHIGWYEWLLEQHPPTSYHQVQLLNDSPMLYYLFYVRK